MIRKRVRPLELERQTPQVRKHHLASARFGAKEDLGPEDLLQALLVPCAWPAEIEVLDLDVAHISQDMVSEDGRKTVLVHLQDELVGGIEKRAALAMEKARREKERDTVVWRLGEGREWSVRFLTPCSVAVFDGAAMRSESKAEAVWKDEGVDFEADFGRDGEEGGELRLLGGHVCEVCCLVVFVRFVR